MERSIGRSLSTSPPSTGVIYTAQLAEALAQRVSISPHFARQILRNVRDLIVENLLADRRTVISGLGDFHTKRVGAKRMRVGLLNNREIHISPHRVPACRMSESLRARIRAATTAPAPVAAIAPQEGGPHG